MATRWHDPEDGYGNVLPQCVACNLYEQGRQWAFGRRLDQAVPGRAEEIMRDSEQARPYGVAELRQLADYYKSECARFVLEKPAINERRDKAKAYNRAERRKAEDTAGAAHITVHVTDA